MPIEIRELIIKVTVQDDANSRAGQVPHAGGLTGPELQRLLQQQQLEVTQNCVRQVLATLQTRRER